MHETTIITGVHISDIKHNKELRFWIPSTTMKQVLAIKLHTKHKVDNKKSSNFKYPKICGSDNPMF